MGFFVSDPAPIIEAIVDQHAEEAAFNGEIPVGAVLVRENLFLAAAGNSPIHTQLSWNIEWYQHFSTLYQKHIVMKVKLSLYLQ